MLSKKNKVAVKIYGELDNNIMNAMYRDKDIMCMTSTRWLIGIYNDAANKSWSKYTTLTK